MGVSIYKTDMHHALRASLRLALFSLFQSNVWNLEMEESKVLFPLFALISFLSNCQLLQERFKQELRAEPNCPRCYSKPMDLLFSSPTLNSLLRLFSTVPMIPIHQTNPTSNPSVSALLLKPLTVSTHPAVSPLFRDIQCWFWSTCPCQQWCNSFIFARIRKPLFSLCIIRLVIFLKEILVFGSGFQVECVEDLTAYGLIPALSHFSQFVTSNRRPAHYGNLTFFKAYVYHFSFQFIYFLTFQTLLRGTTELTLSLQMRKILVDAQQKYLEETCLLSVTSTKTSPKMLYRIEGKDTGCFLSQYSQ